MRENTAFRITIKKLKKNNTKTYLQGRNRDADIENGLMDMEGE